MTRKAIGVVLSVSTALIFAASPAGAHEGHGSCRAAGQFAASTAQLLGAGFGELASSLAQLGQADDFVAGVHATLCDTTP